MPYWGIFPFQLRFIDLHGVAWSFPLTRYTSRRWPVCYLTMIPQWSLSWIIQSGSHFLAFRYHHASFFGKRLLDVWVRFSCGFGWHKSHIWWWMIWCCSIFNLFHVWFHTRTYFPFDWDLQIFMESHDRPHLWDTRRDDDLLAILSWSPRVAFLQPFS